MGEIVQLKTHIQTIKHYFLVTLNIFNFGNNSATAECGTYKLSLICICSNKQNQPLNCTFYPPLVITVCS